MCTASMGQPCGCQLTCGLPQHAQRCHVQQSATGLSPEWVQRHSPGCAAVQCQCSSGVIPSSPLCMHTAAQDCSIPPPAAGWHLLGSLQVGFDTSTPCGECLMLRSGLSGVFTLFFSLPLLCSVKMKCCHSVHSLCNANAVCSLCTCCFPD